jgi:hypothetical protein
MATTMTIGNKLGLTFDFFQPGYSMTAIIANELREAATEIHVSALVAVGLVLFVLSFVLNTAGRLLVLRARRAGGCDRPRPRARLRLRSSSRPPPGRPLRPGARRRHRPPGLGALGRGDRGAATSPGSSSPGCPSRPTVGGGGWANAIVGTVVVSASPCSSGVPIGVGTGIYMSEYGDNPLGRSPASCPR